MRWGSFFLGVFLAVLVRADLAKAEIDKSVAFISVKIGARAHEYCTGFLVGADEVMTASHCLEKIKNEMPSRKNISVRFPNSPTTRVTFEEIVYDSGASSLGNRLDVDYAILKISPAVSLPIMKLSFAPLNDEEDVTVYSMTPLFMGPEFAKFEKMNCRVFRNKFTDSVNPYLDIRNFSSSESPFAFISKKSADSNCELNQGHSGSAVIDSYGYVRGLVRGVARYRETDAFFLSIVSSFTCAAVLPGINNRTLPEVCGILLANKYVDTLFRENIGYPPGDQYVNKYIPN